ncbi:MAG: PAS domain S-box protein [Proteobacteria bacterium]|nr:MAG: PAS domain S-box protein [Pseudomonadota bacterium]
MEKILTMPKEGGIKVPQQRLMAVSSVQEMLENLPILAATALPSGVLTFVNDLAVRQSGRSRTELIGAQIWKIFDLSDSSIGRSEFQDFFEKALSGEVTRLDIPLTQSGGERKETEKNGPTWIDLILRPLHDEAGNVKCILISGMDISERKQQEAQQRNAIRESELYFRSLAETLPQIIWTANPQGEINYTNSQWREYSNSIYPSDWISFTHPEDREKGQKAWDDSLSSGSAFEVDLRLRNKTGSYRWFLLRAVATRDKQGKILNWCGSATDIEERKIQAKELSDAKQEAERANATKSAFLANMSHEIRTPLGAILGFTDLLRDPNTTDEERAGYLDIISRNGKALTRVIDDILDLSKVEAGHMEIEQKSFSLPDLLSEISSLFSETVKAKRLYLSLAEPGWVLPYRGDWRRQWAEILQSRSVNCAGAVPFKSPSQWGITSSKVDSQPAAVMRCKRQQEFCRGQRSCSSKTLSIIKF